MRNKKVITMLVSRSFYEQLFQVVSVSKSNFTRVDFYEVDYLAGEESDGMKRH